MLTTYVVSYITRKNTHYKKISSPITDKTQQFTSEHIILQC